MTRADLVLSFFSDLDEWKSSRKKVMFDPVGLCGLAYWYRVWPLHQVVFAGMLRGLARSADS